MSYNAELELRVADISLTTCYFGLLFFEIFIIVRYLVPLRIKSTYIILFYFCLFVLLISSIVELMCRISSDDSGYMVTSDTGVTTGDYARHISSAAYIVLGFVLSATMFQLSNSLALVLDIIDLPEANRRKWTYNICLLIISLVYIFCSVVELHLDAHEHREHMVFEVLGMVVLCLIYFSTIVDLLRKLNIFVLEETKLEAWYVRLQFIILFIAYTSKVITEMYWIRNPPHERSDDIDSFLMNTDVMQLLWILIPITFLMSMDVRTFRKMRKEMSLLKLVKEKPYTKHSPRGSFEMNRSKLTRDDCSCCTTPLGHDGVSDSEPGTPCAQACTSPQKRVPRLGRRISANTVMHKQQMSLKESFENTVSVPESTTSM